MTSSERRLLAAGITLALGLSPALARAQRSATDLESARQAYNDGIALRDRGDNAGALQKFKAAHALGNTAITGVELCKMHATLKQPVEAREVCLGVGRIPPMAQETSRSVEARTEAARIAEEMMTKMATVKVVVTGVPTGREPVVTVDGTTVPLAALGQARALNPGTHAIGARVGTGPETRATLELREGETKELELVVQPGPEPKTPPPPPPGGDGTKPHEPTKGNTLATAGFVTAGVGVGVGLLAGLVALSSKASLDDKCLDKVCGRADHDALDTARGWGNVATAAFVIGGIGLGAGFVGLFTAPSSSGARARPARPSVVPVFGLGGVGVHGSF